MKYSPEGLQAFVEAVEQGSFSAAARKLKKSQSTVSTAIANLELDLGIELFSRNSRYPQLTEAGFKVLGQVQEILAAAHRLEELSIRLSDQIEPRLTVGLTDVYSFYQDRNFLQSFSDKYPDIELEWLDSEGADVIGLLLAGRAHVGLLASQPSYPTDLVARRLPITAKMGIFVGHTHDLSQKTEVRLDDLRPARQIYLNTERSTTKRPGGRVWSATDYLMVLEMAEQGFGWAVLPQELVRQYGSGRLVELAVEGYPRSVNLDVLWSKNTPPGPAGMWLVNRLLSAEAKP